MHAGFGGRLPGKGPIYRDLAGQPTLQLRPLGLPTWSDKLAGEVVRLLLEAYYEPTFSGHSHGFRPGKGCHTALREVESTWTGTTWFIEGDISDCFGSLDHEIMVTILSEKIHDNRFLRLIRNMLTAGYLEDWEYRETLSGAPQGGVVSPILSNIYLNKLDDFAETVLIPQHTRGKLRKTQPRIQEDRLPTGARTRKQGPGQDLRDCNASCASSPRATRRTPGTVGCVTRATPMIISWGSPDRKPKPRRSRTSWHGSCAKNSRSNSTRIRRWSPTPVPGRPATSAMRSSSSIPATRSPAAAGRSTARSRCGCPWT